MNKSQIENLVEINELLQLGEKETKNIKFNRNELKRLKEPKCKAVFSNKGKEYYDWMSCLMCNDIYLDNLNAYISKIEGKNYPSPRSINNKNKVLYRDAQIPALEKTYNSNSKAYEVASTISEKALKNAKNNVCPLTSWN